MKFNKILYLLVTLISFWGYTQDSVRTDKEIAALIKQAGRHLMNLESEQSLMIAKRALAEALKAEDDLLIAKSYNVIALNFEEFSDYEKAIDFYNKGLAYAMKTDNDTIKDWLHNNLGNVYAFRKRDSKKAIEYYKKSLIYSNRIDTPIEKAYLDLNIASAYFSDEQYKAGYPYLKRAEKTVLESDEVEAKISMYSLLGSYYTYTKEYDKAEKSFKQSLYYCNQDKPELVETHAVEVYDDFATHYFKRGDYKNAYLYLDKYNTQKDKIYNDERTNTTKFAGLQIELDESKRQIDKIESENFKFQRSLKQSKVIVFLFIAILAILLLYVYTLFKSYKRRIKINSELKAANEALFVAKIQAEEASRLKEQFISTVTHELRTPLYGVVGITDLLTDEHKELKDSKYINSLRFSAKYLLSLVNDILQVYKIEEKKITLENSVFNLSDELNSIVESVQFLAVKNNNKLKLDLDPNIPEFLIGDKVRLSQIFMNLITNSLKFTDNGTVKVVAKQLRLEDAFSFIEFKVIDNGIGIKKENQQKVFEKFVQLERRADDYQGTGLGLPIVKQLVEIFGGTIEIESEENVGTTMTFTLAFDTDEQHRNEMLQNLEVDFYEERTYKILVVEDNKINQIVTKKILDVRHFESTIANDGYEAVEILEKETFDVILMDINMPKIDGFETTKLIRDKGIETPIIALTAFDRGDILEKAMQYKMNEVVVKPFEPNQLYKKIIALSKSKTEDVKEST
ncbi:ATP-binding response regulator [Flavobacterium suncheonense]|uniref:ATP-binding response regulator n=1 Tax=Flavobacterium suncheonense TaxID=350894 RepID=UPI0013784ABA|nr:ATP-binding protein [Flavobacterium suncheonense]